MLVDDTGIISATLVSLGTSLSGRLPSPLDLSLIASAPSLSALFASPLSAPLADSLGRRTTIILADALFALGAFLQAASGSVAALVAGRAVVGVAVGAASAIVPVYLAEMARPRWRGMVVGVNVGCVTVGQVAAYIVGWLLSPPPPADGEVLGSNNGWRWMVGLGAVPAILQVLLVLVLRLPETPRWLVAHGMVGEARRVLARVLGTSGVEEGEVEATVREIEAEVAEEEGERRRLAAAAAGIDGRVSKAAGLLARWASGGAMLGRFNELFRVGRNRRALAIACLLQGLQQLCGFNSLMYFSATVFSMLGFEVPTLTSLTVAVTNFFFTLAALAMIDRIGRRRILLASLPFMVLGLLLAAYGFAHVTLHELAAATPTDGTRAPPSAKPPPPPSERSAALLILVSIMLYVAAYALGLGNVPWLQGELFPLSVRSAGSGIATATNWSANFIIGLTFLPLMRAIGPPLTFVIYAIVCTVGWTLVYRIYPETAGLGLEEAGRLLDNGWGVR